MFEIIETESVPALAKGLALLHQYCICKRVPV